MRELEHIWVAAKRFSAKYVFEGVFENVFQSVVCFGGSLNSVWDYFKIRSDIAYKFDSEFEVQLLKTLPEIVNIEELWMFISEARGYDYHSLEKHFFVAEYIDCEYEHLFMNKRRRRQMQYTKCQIFETEFFQLVPPNSVTESKIRKKSTSSKFGKRNIQSCKKMRSMLEERVKRLKIMEENILSIRKEGQSYVQYSCIHCDFVSRRKRKLFVGHIIPLHLKPAKPVKKQKRKRKSTVCIESCVTKTFLCSYLDCSIRFTTRYARKRHVLKVHLKCARFNCTLCEQKFRDSYSLLRHKKLKHRLRSNRCNSCSYTTNRKFNMIRHYERVHHKTGPEEDTISCSVCCKCFLSCYSLKKHMEIHEAIAIGYNCTTCGSVKNEGHKCLFKCSKCVRVYNSYNELKLHTTLHIKIDKLRQSIKTSDDLACVSLELYS